MTDLKRDVERDPRTGPLLGRRALFSRALLAAGAAVGLFGLTGCPGGDDDEGDDGGDDDD